jgi:hypothetical protein
MKIEDNGWGSIYKTTNWGNEKKKKKTASERIKEIIKVITNKR